MLVRASGHGHMLSHSMVIGYFRTSCPNIHPMHRGGVRYPYGCYDPAERTCQTSWCDHSISDPQLQR